ncbi:PAW domain-containing protein [Caenorhabditis elegans]|uniref:PAW domain-containing protein n=1 Tax=Caenorhabditis elegans TaxID=6239 RepID=O18169_CAEEL|nr:PAW domain-containing protein [Caenorhabditis elegans]CAB07681.3 PAW domain-containing protein [Caenorhabditis elegans]
MPPFSNYEPKFNVPSRLASCLLPLAKSLAKISLISIGFLIIFTPLTNAIFRIRRDSNEAGPYSTKVPSMDHETAIKKIVAVTAPNNEPDRNHAGITSTSFTYQNKPIKLSPPSSGDNYVKFTYNVISNTYSQTHEDGSKIDSFYVFNIERVEDRSLNQVYLRKRNTLFMGSITWQFIWELVGKSIEKIVIKIAGIEEYLKYVDGGNANACLTFLAARTQNCSIVPTNKSLTIERPEYDSLSLQLDMFRDIKLLKTNLNGTRNVESFSVEMHWRESSLQSSH